MLFQIFSFIRFYFSAVTRYQIHSPFVFSLTEQVLEDTRSYYAFNEIEALRQKMLSSDLSLEVENLDNPGSGTTQTHRLSNITRQAASSAEQGRMLFKIVQYFAPASVLEMGASFGISTLYMRAACPDARMLSLEVSRQVAAAVQANFEILHKPAPDFRIGSFEKNLKNALSSLERLDLVFIDGHAQPGAIHQYFEDCLPYAHKDTVFIFDHMHDKRPIEMVWEALKLHSRVTLSIDFFELSLLFVSPDFREKQHFNIVKSGLKPWKIF